MPRFRPHGHRIIRLPIIRCIMGLCIIIVRSITITDRCIVIRCIIDTISVVPVAGLQKKNPGGRGFFMH